VKRSSCSIDRESCEQVYSGVELVLRQHDDDREGKPAHADFRN